MGIGSYHPYIALKLSKRHARETWRRSCVFSLRAQGNIPSVTTKSLRTSWKLPGTGTRSRTRRLGPSRGQRSGTLKQRLTQDHQPLTIHCSMRIWRLHSKTCLLRRVFGRKCGLCQPRFRSAGTKEKYISCWFRNV